jgi:methylated-DNA-[protein]-cysteine S-methyltransferase
MTSMGTSGVFAREYDAIDSAVEVGFAGGRVISVSFPGEPPADAADDHDLLDRFGDHFGGARDGFSDVPLGLTVPTDERAVLEALRDVPYGESTSVSRLTRLAGLDDNDPDDLELVTAALRGNPIPVLIADHRVDGGPYATPRDVRTALRDVEGI